MKLLRVMPKLLGSCKTVGTLLPENTLPEAVYDNMKFGDMWEDAEMEGVIRYLKGNTCLLIPAEFRATLLKGDTWLRYHGSLGLVMTGVWPWKQEFTSVLKTTRSILSSYIAMAVKPGFMAVITRRKIRTRKKPGKTRKKPEKSRNFLRILPVIYP